MTDKIEKDLLNVRYAGSSLYETFRKERFVDKMIRLSETIHRNKVNNYQSIHTDQTTAAVTGKKVHVKECVQAQKIVGLARV